MEYAWVSSRSRSISQNWAPHSALHSGLPQTYSAFDTPWNFRSTTMASLCSHTGHVEPVPKGRWRFSWTNRRYGGNLGSLIEPNLKCQSNEWRHPSSPRPKKMHPTQSAVKVIFIVAYGIDGIILHQAVYLQGRRLMLPITARSCGTNFVQRSGEKMTLGGTEPHHCSWQCQESQCCCCCCGTLAPLEMGDSRTSTVLTRYESMRLRALRQREITTAKDTVQCNRWTYPCYRVVNTKYQQRWTRWWCMMPSKHLAKGDKLGVDYVECI